MEKNKGLMTFLVIAVIVLAAILVYSLVINPSVNGDAVKITNATNYGLAQGINAAKLNIFQQLQQSGYVQIPVSSNQSLILIPPQECLQYLQAAQANLANNSV